MKIAFIGQKGFPARYGGVERSVEELARQVAHQGHEVLAYSRRWYTPESYPTPGIQVIFTPSIHTKHLDTISHTFTATLHALCQRVDVIHYHGVGPALLSWIPRLFCWRVKVIATFHCLDRYHQKWGALARLVLRLGEWCSVKFPHATIAVSRTIQNYLLNEYGALSHYIPHGALPWSGNGLASLARWGLTAEKYVLMVARLVPHKGAHALVDAWTKLATRFKDSQGLKLVIVGDSAFTDRYVAQLKKLAAKDPSIVFTGWQTGAALATLIGSARLAVHPSENEGLPLCVLEAMAASRAVLVSDIPEHHDLITDSRFWFKTGDTADLAAALERLLPDTSLLTQAGAANARVVCQQFRWPELAEQIIALYEKPAGGVLARSPALGRAI